MPGGEVSNRTYTAPPAVPIVILPAMAHWIILPNARTLGETLAASTKLTLFECSESGALKTLQYPTKYLENSQQYLKYY